MAKTIATRMFLQSIDEGDRPKHLREGKLKRKPLRLALQRYRKLVVQLSKRAKVVEQKMCRNAFDEIVPAETPAVATKKYRKVFQNKTNDGSQRSTDPRRAACAENFAAAIKDAIATGVGIKGTVAGAHGICKPYVDGQRLDQMTEAQWANLIKEMKDGGSLGSCFALCDVSGSMSGVPMEVCVALGLVVAELASGPFKDHVLTFETDPKFHRIEGETLHAKVRNLLRAPWGGSTDFAKALNLMLQVAVSAKVRPEDMPQMLIVFSDMQFNVAESGGYYSGTARSKTGFVHATASIREAFRKAGYEMPHLVFWNLRGSCTAQPCETISEGVSTMSGYSQAMLKAFMEGKVLDMAKETPWDRVKAVLDDERYEPVDRLVKEYFRAHPDAHPGAHPGALTPGV
jgi:hypothetical protein